jgi:hypothetical protein
MVKRDDVRVVNILLTVLIIRAIGLTAVVPRFDPNDC